MDDRERKRRDDAVGEAAMKTAVVGAGCLVWAYIFIWPFLWIPFGIFWDDIKREVEAGGQTITWWGDAIWLFGATFFLWLCAIAIAWAKS